MSSTELATINKVLVSAYQIPTEKPESDGTYEWKSTTLILVEVFAGNQQGLGYTYGNFAVAQLIHEKLISILKGEDVFYIGKIYQKLNQAIRNLGRPGIVSMAISAIDVALWDLKAKLLNIPLAHLFNPLRTMIPVYGSGGLTSYTDAELTDQFRHWSELGIKQFKMKIGREPQKDFHRVGVARQAIGKENQLFVDANGAFSRKYALWFAEKLVDFNVTWFEEPVSSDDLEGLNLIRNRAPAGMEISAGEYGYELFYFRRMLCEGAVDVLQADATRCGGYTGILSVNALSQAYSIDLSTHTAPQLHLHVSLAIHKFRHLEYFCDHVDIENRVFDGAILPADGNLQPDLSRPGLGLEFKYQDASKYKLG